MSHAPDRFTTRRLVGTRISGADLEDFQAYYADPEVMRRLSPTGEPYEASAASELLGGHVAHWAEHGYGTWIFRLPDGRFVARAGLRCMELDDGPVVELFYGVSSDRWDEGFATEVALAIIDVAFDSLGLTSLVAFALPTNAASLRVLEKCGFEEVGEISHAGLRHGLFRLLRA